jgi:hypothetical protein
MVTQLALTPSQIKVHRLKVLNQKCWIPKFDWTKWEHVCILVTLDFDTMLSGAFRHFLELCFRALGSNYFSL